MKNSLRNLIIFALLWQFTVYLNLFNGKLPSLIEVKNALIDYNVLVEICLSLLITLKFVLASLTIGTILGYSIGTFIGLTPKIKSIIYPFLNAIKTLPITILLPLFLSVFGYENYPIPIISLPILAIVGANIAEATIVINLNRTFTAKFLSMSKFNYWLHILRWDTLDVLFSSLRIVLTFTLALQIAFEYFLMHQKGIGYYIKLVYEGSRENKQGETYLAIIIVAFLGIISIKFLDLISKNILKWKVQI